MTAEFPPAAPVSAIPSAQPIATMRQAAPARDLVRSRALARHIAACTLILLLAAALRIINLAEQPLWADEGFSAYAIAQPDLLEALRRDVHPPLYFAGLKAWAALTGMSELALRWFSVLPSLLSVAVIVPLARELAHLRPRPTPGYALPLAALLMALAEMEYYIVGEVRSYSLHVLLALVSTWGLLRWLRLGERRAAAIWLLSMTALIYTHYLGAWLGVVHGLYALLLLRRRTRLVTIALLCVPAALFAGWLILIVLPYQTLKADADATIDASTLETLVWYARSYLTGQWPLMLGLLLLGLGSPGAEGRPRLRPVNASALLLLWIVVPVLLTFIGNLRFSILTYYRISLITPAFVLLWAFGLTVFPRPTRLFLIAVVTAYGVMSVDFYRPKFPEREFAALASQFALPGDLVLIDMKGVDFSPQYYLSRQLPDGADLASLRQYTIWDPPGLYNVLIPQLGVAETVWLLRWNDEPLALDLLRDAGLAETAHRVMRYGDDRLEAYRFDRLTRDSAAPLATFGRLTLHRAEVHPELLRVDLWWSADAPLTVDLTTSAILLDADGRLVAQFDSMPFLNERPTSTWEAGALMYEPKPMRRIDGLDALPAGVYTVGVQVYRLTRAGEVRQITADDGAPYRVVGEIVVGGR